MRDKLIDLITIGITRYSIQQASGNNPDMAAIIADVLIENDYCKASDIIEEIFDYFDSQIGKRGLPILTHEYVAELKKKYIGKDTNVTTNTEEGK